MVRFLVVLVLVLVILGFGWPWLSPWLHHFHLGSLPGDTTVKIDNFTFYFPITTAAIIAFGLALLLWLLGR